MEDQLHPRPALPLKPRVKQPSPITEIRAADIALLEARTFLHGAKREGVVIGSTSLYEIDRLIEDRKGEDVLPDGEEELRRLVYEKLPQPYQSYAGCFSKATSDTLPPHREGVDHDIILEGSSSDLAPSPLYNMSLEQLELVKAYL